MDRAAWLEARARDLLARGKLGEAEVSAVEAGRLCEQLRGSRHPDTGRIAELVAAIKVRLGDYQAAEQVLLAALAAREAEAGPGSLPVAEVLDLLGSAAEHHAPDRAAAFWGRALAIRKTTLGAGHSEVARTLIALGAPLLKLCRAADAEAALREALAIRERTAGPMSAGVIEPLEMLSEARWQVFDDSGSEQLLVRATTASEPLDATQAESLTGALGRLAEKERDRKDFASATMHQERALLVAERRLGSTSSVVLVAADGLATMYRAQGNEAAVSALFQRLSLVERILPPGAAVPNPPPKTTLGPPLPRCTPPGSPVKSVSNAQSVVAGLAPSFRACYNRALQQDPETKGSIRIKANIGAGGEVVRVRTLVPASYAELMVKCPMERLLAAPFTPPEGGGATLVVPVIFNSR